MLYRVLVDGDDILDYTQQDMVLLSPQAEIELDVSGSFEFTIPPNHIYYDRFTAETIMKMLIEIYEDTTLHWFGRPIELHLDFYKNKKIYCEGALGFFNDSVIREAEYEDTLLSTIFAAVIAEHNMMVDSNRQFTVGQFTVPDHTVYRKFNYEQTSDVLKSKFLDAEEGHFFVRRENGVNYIDFLQDMPYTCDQPVQFAKNLLNFTYSFDGKDFATCVIPLGANDSESGKPITIASVNNNSDILIGNSAANYGKIVKVQQYSDLTDPNELLSEGRKYLTNLAWNAYLIECSAVDLHTMTPEVEDVVIEEGETEPDQLFRVGQTVTCISNPHGINLQLPLSKMTLYLDSAAKQITLGRIPKKTLARFYKDNISPGDNGASDIEDQIPEGFAIVPDPGTGEPTLAKVPVTMQIMTLPYRDGSQQNSTYAYGDTLDFTGLTAKLVAKGQTQHGSEEIQYFTDSHYPDSYIPFNELSFDHSTYDQHVGKLMVWCTWTNPNNLYNGVKFKKAFYMQSLSEAAAAAANGPVRIEIIKQPSKTSYYDGEHINMSGATVVAFRQDGSRYNDNGYINGVIPNSELVLSPAVVDSDSAEYGVETGTVVNTFGTIPYITGGFSAKQVYHGSISIGQQEDVRRSGSWSGNGYFVSYRDDGIPSDYASFSQSSLIFSGKDDGTLFEEGSFTVPYSIERQNPIDGKTYYYNTSFFNWSNDGTTWVVESSATLSKPSGIDSRYWALDVLMAQMSGTELNKNKQMITVTWKTPSGNSLSASFYITINNGGILSGR